MRHNKWFTSGLYKTNNAYFFLGAAFFGLLRTLCCSLLCGGFGGLLCCGFGSLLGRLGLFGRSCGFGSLLGRLSLFGSGFLSLFGDFLNGLLDDLLLGFLDLSELEGSLDGNEGLLVNSALQSFLEVGAKFDNVNLVGSGDVLLDGLAR